MVREGSETTAGAVRARQAGGRRATVGIVGCGRFGAFLAQRLAREFDVVVSDRSDRRATARAAGARWGSVADVASSEWVVPAVPIGELRGALLELLPQMTPGATLVEVSSVKALPSRWLRELAPEGVAAVATHPLFGPDSAARSLRGLPLVVCPISGHHAAARRVAAYGRSRGLRVVWLDPESHDRAMARTQALTFFLSRTLGRLDLPDPDEAVGTLSYRRLRAALASVARDTDELYRDLVGFNPHARRFLADLAGAVAAERARVVDAAAGEGEAVGAERPEVAEGGIAAPDASPEAGDGATPAGDAPGSHDGGSPSRAGAVA